MQYVITKIGWITYETFLDHFSSRGNKYFRIDIMRSTKVNFTTSSHMNVIYRAFKAYSIVGETIVEVICEVKEMKP